jgi:microcystin-dependent protein
MKILGSLFGNGRLRAAFFMSLAVAWSVGALFLFVPPPHPASAQFVEQSTYGGTSTGSANAQAISIPNLRGHTPGVVLRFIPGFSNSGPATLNDGFGAVPIVRPSSIGNVALSGQELLAGELTCVTYNSVSSAYQLSCNVDVTPIGKVEEIRGTTTAPRGRLIEDGSCVLQSTYAALFSVIGTSYGSCPTGQFALPDSKGRAIYAYDNQGAGGAAGVITNAGSGCNNATTVGGQCGGQNKTIITSYLPASGLSVPALSIPSLAVNVSTGALHLAAYLSPATIPVTSTGSDFAVWDQSGSGSIQFITSIQGSTTANVTSGGTTGNMGSGMAMPILPPADFALRVIKY